MSHGFNFNTHRAAPSVTDPLLEGLVLLCKHLGRIVTLAEISYGLALEKGRLPLLQAPKALRRAGITARVLDIPLTQLNARLLPALLHLKDGTNLLLVQSDGSMVTVLDPLSAGGAHKLPIKYLQCHYTGKAILARPIYRPDGRTQEFAQPLGQHWLKDVLKAEWRDYAYVALATLMANILAAGISLFALQVYDRVVPNSAFDTLWLLAFGALIAILFEFILRNLRANTLETLGKRIDLHLSSVIFEKVLGMRLQSKPTSVGAFSNQIKEFETVRDFFTSTTAATISDIPFIFLFIVMIYIIGGKIALVPFFAAIVILIIGLIYQSRLAAFSRQNLRDTSTKSGVLLEALSQLETVKTTVAEGRLQKQWEILSAELAANSVRMRMFSTGLSYASVMVQQLCYVGVVIVGVYLISTGDLSMGALVACTMLSGRATAPISQIAGLLSRWQHVKVAVEGLDKIMLLPSDRTEGRQYARKQLLVGKYQLTEVESRYQDQGPPVVKITQLIIKSGEHIALLGRNGAGKSTLLRLLSGLSSPSQGQITLDDLSILQIDPADLRHNIGYLPQDVGLFYGTLRDNLAPHNTGQTDAEMLHAIDAVGLSEFVRAHPMGLDMQIIDSHSVSGGQRQAIGLARILLQDPRIVLMDEPTSAFDQASEEHVIKYLQHWLKGRTLVLSTHKRALLKLTERVIVISRGKVALDGPLDEIIKDRVVELPNAAR